MPEAGPSNPRLSELQERWQQDPSSRVYLQLTEELRKLGRHDEALAVLAKSLEKRPRDLSGLVALGRCRLEIGEAELAVEVLESVVERDPAHIVANKLLIEAHLQNREEDKAAQRLNIYRLLNDRDPELEHLTYRLERLQRGDSGAGTAAADGQATSDTAEIVPARLIDEEDRRARESAVDPDEATDLAAEPADEEVFQSAAASVDTAELIPPPMVVPDSSASLEATNSSDSGASSAESGNVSMNEVFPLAQITDPPNLDTLWEEAREIQCRNRPLAEPFADLPRSSLERHWQVIAGEGIFSPPAELATPPPEASAVGNGQGSLSATAVMDASEPVEVDESSAAAPEPKDEALAESEEEVGSVAADGFAAAPAAGIALTAVAATAATAVSVGEGASSDQATAAPEVSENEPRDAEPPTQELAPSVDHPETSGERPSAAAPTSTVPTPVQDEGSNEGVATATLGKLYLAQGHLDEAEKIFRRVLARDPHNETALAGLASLDPKSSRPPLTAADLLADPGFSGALPAGLTAKKILVLQSYLKRLRSKGQQDVR